MKMLKKIVSLLLVFSFLLIPLPVEVSAATSGTAGDNITWTLENGVLTLSGTGTMKSFWEVAPWYDSRSAIKEAVIQSGITSISNAFYDCYNLTSVTIPESVTSIGSSAFNYCNNLSFVIYNGTQKQWEAISIHSSNDELLNAGKHYVADGHTISSVESCSIIANVCSVCGFLDGTLKSTSTHSFTDGVCTICGVEKAWKYSLAANGKGITLTSYEGSATELTIPATIEGIPVTTIGKYAFQDNNQITSVTIPEGVEFIGPYAFNDCVKLTSITIPASVKEIDSGAFSYCNSLTNVYISDLAAWCGIAFSIGLYSDNNANPLYYAQNFYVKGEKVTDLVIPQGVTDIAYSTFYGFDSLTSVTIPDSVISIGQYTFRACSNLQDVTFGSNVTDIGNYAFSKCGSLKTLTLPEKLQRIGYNAFEYCSQLTSVAIPESVTYLGSEAFYNCSGLQVVQLPGSLSYIESSTFDGCNSLGLVLYGGTKLQWDNLSVGSNNYPLLNAKVHYNDAGHTVTAKDTCSQTQYHCSQCGLLAGFKKAAPTHNFVNNICTVCSAPYGWEYHTNAEGTITVDRYTGPDAELVIPSQLEGIAVTEIASSAFSGNSSITSVTIPQSIKKIGSAAFYNCYNLSAVYITDVAAWCNINFYYETSNPLRYASKLYLNGELVTDLVIPEGVTTIGNYAFYNCRSITSVTIPKSVTSIGWYAFYDCYSLADVYIFDLAAWCGINFANGSANPLLPAENLYVNGKIVKNLEIPQSVTQIAYSAFAGSDGLLSINIPDSVKQIDSYAFSDTGAQLVILGKGLTQVNRYAFYQDSYYGNEILHTLYTGTEAQWNALSIASGNASLVNATRHYNANKNMFSFHDSCSYSRVDCTECGTIGMSTVPVPQHNFKNGVCTFCKAMETWQYRLSTDGVTFTGYTGTAGKLTIPATIEGMAVVSISENAFYNNRVITEVVIPDSVKNIEYAAFEYAKNLKKVDLGDGVTQIYPDAFRNCTSLESIVIPEGVSQLYRHTFSGCTALTAVTLPASLTEIYEWAFYNCKNLDHVMYGGTQAQQDAMLIDGTNDTLLTATWHCGVNEMSLHASSKQLCSAVALFDCDVCKATCYQAKEHPEHNFINGKCTACSLAENCPWSYEISGTGVEITGYNATQGGTAPKIPETIEGLPVTAIGNRALVDCDSVTSIFIPKTVTTIGYSAFRDCDSLAKVFFGGDQETWEAVLKDSNNDPLIQALIQYLASLLAGDLDGNETVNRDDVVKLLLHVTMPGRFPIEADADFTGDGKINRDDVVKLLLHVTMPNRFPL